MEPHHHLPSLKLMKGLNARVVGESSTLSQQPSTSHFALSVTQTKDEMLVILYAFTK